MLAHHVVGGRQDLAERGPPQDDLAGVARHPVGEVGLAAGDQRHVAVDPARVVQHADEQRRDDARLGAGADRLQALRRWIVEAGRHQVTGSGTAAGERPPERPLVVGGVAELALAHDDPAQEPVGRVLGRHRRCRRRPASRRGRPRGPPRRRPWRSTPSAPPRRPPRRAPPPRRARTTRSWPGGRTDPRAGAAAPGSCRSAARTGAARRRTRRRRRASGPPRRPPRRRRAARRSCAIRGAASIGSNRSGASPSSTA